jgi:hypothetical protein
VCGALRMERTLFSSASIPAPTLLTRTSIGYDRAASWVVFSMHGPTLRKAPLVIALIGWLEITRWWSSRRWPVRIYRFLIERDKFKLTWSESMLTSTIRTRDPPS